MTRSDSPRAPGWISRAKHAQNARHASDFGPPLPDCVLCGQPYDKHDFKDFGAEQCPTGGTVYSSTPVEVESEMERARR